MTDDHAPRFEGETNVISSRFGRGAVDGLGLELGRFVVTTMDIPWRVTKDHLRGSPESVIQVESMEADVVDRLVAQAPACDTVVAIGGGMAIDLGKYFAWKRGCRLVTIPTIVSVDAFVTPAAAIRKNYRVEYVGKASPDPLVIDYDLIRTAPVQLNIAGAGDLLSMHTACFDWEVAHRLGKDSHGFTPEAQAQGRKLLEWFCDQADAIAQVNDEGIRAIVDGYMWLNTLCLPAGHYRIEEGSEHFLFYELEERLQKPFLHGQIVGLGIYILSRLQDNEPEKITAIMERMGLDFHPRAMGIERASLVESLENLATFVRARGLWYSIIDERPITRDWISETLKELRFT